VYSAGGPSRWPFGHILVLHAFVSCDCMYCIYYNVYVVRVPVLVIVVLVCVGRLSLANRTPPYVPRFSLRRFSLRRASDFQCPNANH